MRENTRRNPPSHCRTGIGPRLHRRAQLSSCALDRLRARGFNRAATRGHSLLHRARSRSPVGASATFCVCWTPLTQREFNRLQHRVDVVQDLMVREAKDQDSCGRQQRISLSNRRRWRIVLPAVGFHRYRCPLAVEVEHVRPNRMLPAELVAPKSARAIRYPGAWDACGLGRRSQAAIEDSPPQRARPVAGRIDDT